MTFALPVRTTYKQENIMLTPSDFEFLDRIPNGEPLIARLRALTAEKGTDPATQREKIAMMREAGLTDEEARLVLHAILHEPDEEGVMITY